MVQQWSEIMVYLSEIHFIIVRYGLIMAFRRLMGNSYVIKIKIQSILNLTTFSVSSKFTLCFFIDTIVLQCQGGIVSKPIGSHCSLFQRIRICPSTPLFDFRLQNEYKKRRMEPMGSCITIRYPIEVREFFIYKLYCLPQFCS